MNEILRFPVFRDDKGNRFVFPGVYVSKDRPYNWDRCRTLCMALNLTEEKDCLSVKDEGGELIFPHIVASAAHPGFAHGGTTVWIIGGPEFDAVAKAPERPTADEIGAVASTASA